MGKKTCAYPGCNTKIEPWMKYCYKHYHMKKGDYNAKKLQQMHGGTKKNGKVSTTKKSAEAYRAWKGGPTGYKHKPSRYD